MHTMTHVRMNGRSKYDRNFKIACVDRRNVFLDQLFTLITNPVLKVLGHKAPVHKQPTRGIS